MSLVLRSLLLLALASTVARASPPDEDAELGALVHRALARAGLDGTRARAAPTRLLLPSLTIGGGAGFAPNDAAAVAVWSVWARLGWPLGETGRISVGRARDDAEIAREKERIVRRVGELWHARRRLASRAPPGDALGRSLVRLEEEQLTAELAALVGPEVSR